MKVKIELDSQCDEIEIVIRTPELSDQVEDIQRALSQLTKPPLVFYKGTSKFFLNVAEILFFETEGSKIFAHSRDNAYEVRLKLYELEDYLPGYFSRVAKSTIVNVKSIYSLDRSFSGTSTIRFYKTHKQVHVSRHYYQLLKETLRELR
ncbi:LytTR family DNA-binding domain-containing protein [Streptococcus moroccensis]|uniref:DNA-binding LytR/AlgR family response regulator n=1 Tax=Streptococcus moroccensis TaxID=1451356 RepID=A0ABT9YPY2_9STRE|nr:LytTR family DNA-binding domain-containing protein [Streptococcus moroccensis]MDQ0222038.1 DNA-binding LytR/AlgR family response regulator [Streptococcus moroccensis]